MATAETSGKIRVIIVDDSIVYRNLIHNVLQEDPYIDVVSLASNGRLAMPRIKHYLPDFVILDQEMPEMTGLELLEIMRRDFPEIGVLMFSSHTLEGAKITLRALELGALDFVPKRSFSSEAEARQYIRQEVIGKLKGLFGRVVKKIPEVKPVPKGRIEPVKPVQIDVAQGYYEACAIGISTGGPVALRNLLPLLPESLGGALFIVQHMPPLFTKQLADSLQDISQIRIVEGEDGMDVQRGFAYIAPGGRHMTVERSADKKIIRILDTEPEMNCKPSVNIMFRSIGAVYGDRSCGVIMTGMGTDGFEGMKVMRSHGSYLIAQNRESCLIFGMPNLPVKEGLTHETLDIVGIAQKVTYLLGAR